MNPSPQINDTELAEGSLEILVVTDDRPGLLADLAAALSVHRYEVASTRFRFNDLHSLFTQGIDLFVIFTICEN